MSETEGLHTLYGSQGSGSAAVEVALERTGAPFRIIRASSWEPDSALGELEKLNPLRQVPTLQLPDGSVLTESAAILVHLGLSFPASGLLPADATARAQSIRGLVFITANCYSAISIIDFPERWIADPDEAANERIRRAARGRLHQHWQMFADTFAARPFLSGDEPGALDFLAAVVSRWSGTRPHLRTHRPEFLSVLERIEAHPSVASVFARHWP
ncbi:glutathione S-transferase family protein [Piscinibacter sp. XHJ-5]|uniref:glutathione S-transferase family protein n=1 Tax=Piscinibacter sp. XHJ-5 TaxID=3037797 RepID=UPI002452E29A|nr:glutathione S-transferase family protein [Piscinibacter sp. XHJ-5]